jgi:hypothetical protein
MRDALLNHLANLKRQQLITAWHDRKISAGNEWAGEIDQHLNTASLILLLISPDFMSSNYCNDVEVEFAMKRHEAGDAKVIPVILRPVDWAHAPFSKLQALPKDAKPVLRWSHRDEAYLDIANGIRNAIGSLGRPSTPDAPMHFSKGTSVPTDSATLVANEEITIISDMPQCTKDALNSSWGLNTVPSSEGSHITEFNRTPRLGIEIWQRGKARPLFRGPQGAVSVPLVSAPFELRFANIGDAYAVMITVWSMPDIFEGVADFGPIDQISFFGGGTGMAESPFGDAVLVVTREGHHHLDPGGRLQVAPDRTAKVLYSAIRMPDGSEGFPHQTSIYVVIGLARRYCGQNLGTFERIVMTFA